MNLTDKKPKLIRYRDNQSWNYIWFWATHDDKRLSPEFNSPEEAENWMRERI